MVRAHDSNVDRKRDDASKIHWGKFTLMARMIVSQQVLQDKIRSSGQYDFPERRWIREMINNDVMDVEVSRRSICVQIRHSRLLLLDHAFTRFPAARRCRADLARVTAEC
jgi:hypothetical protein